MKRFDRLSDREGRLNWPRSRVLLKQNAAAADAKSAESGFVSGGDRRDRTDDLMLAKQLLSQLSYVPKLFNSTRSSRYRHFLTKVPVAPSQIQRSWDLAGGGNRWMWWAWKDLNFRPHAYQARALTS
jgi:hypothetical protein